MEYGLRSFAEIEKESCRVFPQVSRPNPFRSIASAPLVKMPAAKARIVRAKNHHFITALHLASTRAVRFAKSSLVIREQFTFGIGALYAAVKKVFHDALSSMTFARAFRSASCSLTISR